MGEPDSHRKLAEVVEALRDVEGVRVEHSAVVDLPVEASPIHQFLELTKNQTEDGLLVVLRMGDSPELEIPDDPDGTESEDVELDDAIDIELS